MRAMKRVVTGTPLVGVLLLLLFSFSASAGTATGAKSKPPTLHTLVATYGKIYAFAQDSRAVGWIAGDARVRVRLLATGRTSVVGKVDPQERARGPSSPWPARVPSGRGTAAGTVTKPRSRAALWAKSHSGPAC